MSATIATFDNYKVGNKILSGKYLLACTKARLIIFDYYKLFGKIKGEDLFDDMDNITINIMIVDIL